MILIKKNGVLDQVKAALNGVSYVEFGGIEPSPHYETLVQAVEMVKREEVDFLLAVGGGSVIDGTKFVAAAARYPGGSWDIIESKGAVVKEVIPFSS